MASIREELVLADKFSATFNRYATLGTNAANVSDLASRSAANYQSVLSGLDRRLITLNSQFSVVANKQAALVAAGKRNTAEFANLEALAEKLGATIRDLQTQYGLVSTEFDEVSAAAREAAGAQDDFAESSSKSITAGDGLAGTLKRLAGGWIGLQGVKGLFNLSDTMAQTSARLNMVNEQFGTTADLSNMVYAAAQKSRGAYGDMADFVGKLGTLAPDAFSGPEELVAFAEQINKQYALAGTSSQGAQAATLQLTQALSSGVLRGEELNSVLEQAPTIVQTIGDYLGKSTGEIRELASEGKITSEIVKNAILGAADETNAKFEQMPMTWAQVWTKMQNTAIMALQPVLNGINWLANNLDIIGPPLAALATIFLVCAGATAAYNAQIKIKAVWDALAAARAAMLNGATLAQAAATTTATGAQVGLNAAMLASPITWIVGGVLLLVGVLYAGVAAYNKLTGSSVSATGIIAGAMGGLFALIANGFIFSYNIVADFANFLYNVFNDPVAAVQILFLDMVQTVLGFIAKLAQGIEDLINNIPGVEVNIASKINGAVEWAGNQSEELKNSSGWKEYVEKIDYADPTQLAAKGYEMGANFKLFGGSSAAENLFDSSDYANDMLTSVNGIGKEVSAASEDLKSLVDMAERRYVNNINLTTKAPVINIQGQNTGNTAADARAIADTIKYMLIEESASSSSISTATPT